MISKIVENLNIIKDKVTSLKSKFREVALERNFIIPEDEKFSNYPDYFTPEHLTGVWQRPKEWKEFHDKVENEETVEIGGVTRSIDGSDVFSLGVIFIDSETTTTFKGSSYCAVRTSDGAFYDLSDGSTVIHTWKTSGTNRPNRWVIYYFYSFHKINATFINPTQVPLMNGYAVYYVMNGSLTIVGGYYANFNVFTYTKTPYLQAIEVTKKGRLIEDTSAWYSNSHSTAFVNSTIQYIGSPNNSGEKGLLHNWFRKCYNLTYAPIKSSGISLSKEYWGSNILDLQGQIAECKVINLDAFKWDTYAGDYNLFNNRAEWRTVKGVMDLSVSPLTVEELSLWTSSAYMPDLKIKLPRINVKMFTSTSYSVINNLTEKTWIYLADNAPEVDGKTLTTHHSYVSLMKTVKSKTNPDKTLYEVMVDKGWSVVGSV